MSVWQIAALALVLSIHTTAQAEEKKEKDKKVIAAAETNPTGPEIGSDKLDLKQLEDKYWSAKDSDFGVVQNRTYDKDKRPFASLSYGPMVNDAYSVGRMMNFSGGYFFNERWGVELAYEKGNLADNGSTSALAQYNGLKPNFNKFVDYTSINVMWVPMYAKMSVVDKAIWYFDLQIAAGLGNMNYQAQIDPTEGANVNRSSVGFNFDTSAQIFFHRKWAFRFDIKNKWSSQDLTRFRLSGSGASNRNMGTQTQQDTTMLLGITYFH